MPEVIGQLMRFAAGGVAAQAAVDAAIAGSKPRRARARKIRTPLGPFQTNLTTFERGKERPIEIVRITPAAIIYRVTGFEREYVLPHSVACQKAMSLAAGANIDPRSGPLKRGGTGGA